MTDLGEVTQGGDVPVTPSAPTRAKRATKKTAATKPKSPEAFTIKRIGSGETLRVLYPPHGQKNTPFKGSQIVHEMWMEADFEELLIEDAIFSKCDFSRASFKHARLINVTMQNCNLSGANFRSTQLEHSRFFECTFIENEFWGADFVDTDCIHCDGFIDLGMRGNFRFSMMRHERGPMIHAGCRWFTLEQALYHWQRENYHSPNLGREAVARITMGVAIAIDKGWPMSFPLDGYQDLVARMAAIKPYTVEADSLFPYYR